MKIINAPGKCIVWQSPLTPRQIEILLLLIDGLGTKEIAWKLKITPKSVDKHLRHARARSGAKTNCEIVAMYFKRLV